MTNAATLVQFDAGATVQRTIHGVPGRAVHVLMESTDLVVFYSELHAGEALPPERHDVIEAIIRLAGTTRHTVGDDSFVVDQGSFVPIPAFVQHGCEVLGDDPVCQITILARNQYAGPFFADDGQ